MAAARDDVLVIGGGVEGLAAAATLASAGRRVRLVAAEERLGELDAAREIAPGFRAPGIRPLPAPRPWLIDSLALASHGLALHGEPETLPVSFRALLEVAEEVGGGWNEPLPTLRAIADEPPPEVLDPGLRDLAGLGRIALGSRRRLGRVGFAEVLRMLPMSIEDWLSERVPDRALRAELLSPALFGGWVGPLSPSTAFLWCLAHAGESREPAGGPPALVAALEGAARARGVEIELGAPVRALVIEGGRARGALTGRGERPAGAVLSTAPPRTTLLEWVPPRELTATLREEVAAVRCRGIVAAMQVALGRRCELPAAGSVGEDPLDWERAFDAAKHGALPERPVLRFRDVSSGAAPEGSQLLQLEVFGVPRVADPVAGAEQRRELERRVLARLEERSPGLGAAVVAMETLTPGDLEREHLLPGGHLDHAELALDQVFSLRPTGLLGRYRTPIAGLWIAGRGAHPGGPFPGSSGALAARAMLRAGR